MRWPGLVAVVLLAATARSARAQQCAAVPAITSIDRDSSREYCEGTASGSYCNFKCLGGYAPSGPATCLNGYWNRPTCDACCNRDSVETAWLSTCEFTGGAKATGSLSKGSRSPICQARDRLGEDGLPGSDACERMCRQHGCGGGTATFRTIYGDPLGECFCDLQSSCPPIVCPPHASRETAWTYDYSTGISDCYCDTGYVPPVDPVRGCTWVDDGRVVVPLAEVSEGGSVGEYQSKHFPCTPGQVGCFERSLFREMKLGSCRSLTEWDYELMDGTCRWSKRFNEYYTGNCNADGKLVDMAWGCRRPDCCGCTVRLNVTVGSAAEQAVAIPNGICEPYTVDRPYLGLPGTEPLAATWNLFEGICSGQPRRPLEECPNINGLLNIERIGGATVARAGGALAVAVAAWACYV